MSILIGVVAGSPYGISVGGAPPITYPEWAASSLVLPTNFVLTRASDRTVFEGATFAARLISTKTTDVSRFAVLSGDRQGLLLEGARTNLLLRSSTFDNATWVKTRASVTANVVTSPGGSATGDALIEDTTATNTHAIQQTVTLAAGTRVAYSCWIKRHVGTRNARMSVSTGSNSIAAVFDLAAVTATPSTTGDGSGASAGIEAYPNGWFRCWVAGIFSATVANPNCFVTLLSGTTQSYTGDGVSALGLWNAQLEAADFPSSAINTSTTTVAHAAETASRAVTLPGGGFTGIVEAVIGAIPVVTPQTLWSIDDGTDNNRFSLTLGTDGILRAETFVGGVAQAQNASGVLSPYTRVRAAMRFNANNFRAAVNGTLTALDSSGSMPTGLTTERLGTRVAGANPYFGHILGCHQNPVAWRPPAIDADLVTLSTLT